MNTYPSDIEREQFQEIRPILESARKKTKPRRVDLFEIFNAVLYVVKTGCQWRALPKDFPKWRTVHEYFLIWSKTTGQSQETILEEVLKKIGGARAITAWEKRQAIDAHHRRSKCEKHRDSSPQRL